MLVLVSIKYGRVLFECEGLAGKDGEKMRWENFGYLVPAAATALLLLVLLARLTPQLAKPSKHRTPAELMALLVVTALGLAVIYWNFYTSKTFFVYNIGDAGSDTTEQYFPFYLWLVDSVRNRSLSFWTWEFELGVPVQTFQSWLFDPFNLIVVPTTLLLGDAKLSVALTVSQSAKIALSAVLFDHLLTRYCETPLARLLGSVLYAFSGHTIMWGQHYWFGAALPLFAATILVFELFLEQPRPASFIRATAVVALELVWSAYVSYMILLATAIYLLFRIPLHLDRAGLVSYLGKVTMLFLPVVCGVLVAGASWVPYAVFLMHETARITGPSPIGVRLLQGLLSFVKPDWIPALLSRMVGTGLLTTGMESSASFVPSAEGTGFVAAFGYEFPVMGYSAVVFLLLAQYYHWLIVDGDARTRRLALGATAVVLLYCVHRLLPSVFNMMVGVQYRSSFVLALPVCAAMAVGFEKRVLEGTVAKAPLLISALGTLGVLTWSLVHTLNGRLVCLFYLLAAVASVVVLFLVGGQQYRCQLVSLLIACAFSSLVVDGLFVTSCRRMVEPDGVPHATGQLESSSVVRAITGLREQDDSFYRLDKTFPAWVPLNDSLLQHYAGASAYNSCPDADVDRFYHQLWEEAISGWAVCSQGFYNSPDHPEIASLLNLKYVLSLEELDWDWLTPVDRVDDLFVYENAGSPSLATLRRAVVSESAADALDSAAARRELLKDYVIVPDDVAASWEGEGTGDGAQTPAVFHAEGTMRIAGTIDAAERSVVCLSIPHTGTWTIRVDGEEVPTFRADYGFYGFVVERGAHQVEASYLPGGVAVGVDLSLVGIVGTAVCANATRRRNRGGHLATAASHPEG